MLSPASVSEEIEFYISSAQANFLAETIAGLASAGMIISVVREHLVLFSPGLQNSSNNNHLQKATVF